MDSENIDKLFEAIQKGYNKKLWGFAEMDTTYTTKKWAQFSEEVYARIMKRIEEGDIEYFLRKTICGVLERFLIVRFSGNY